MQDTLELFNEIVNNRYFKHIHIILFLNKKDIFAQKITRMPLTVCFPNYKYKSDYKNASVYIAKKFEKQIEDRQKIIYPHFTCAT
ncbi:guanine nucleotide-binding protein G(z) subunit alpha isoform 1, partial [Aphelenchoides avenae]